jgi:hypothetical protein
MGRDKSFSGIRQELVGNLNEQQEDRIVDVVSPSGETWPIKESEVKMFLAEHPEWKVWRGPG